MSAAQIIAVVIFLAMFVMIVMDKVERQYVTLVSGGLVIAIVFGLCLHSGQAIIDTLNVKPIFTTAFWYGKSEGVSVGTYESLDSFGEGLFAHSLNSVTVSLGTAALTIFISRPMSVKI